MSALLMGHQVMRMAVSVNVPHAIAVLMLMKMHTVTQEPPQHVHAEADQHDPDRRFERLGHIFGNRVSQQDRSAGKDKERERMAQAPGQAMLDDIADTGSPRSDARHGGDMIGLECMLHPEQETQSEHAEHLFPQSLDIEPVLAERIRIRRVLSASESLQ